MRSSTRPTPPGVRAAVVVAYFVAAFLVYRYLGGPSPIAWIDTFNDQEEVRRCVSEDSCTLLGIPTSVPKMLHAVGWLQWLSVMSAMGFDLDDVHTALQLMNATGALLTILLAHRLGGVVAGAAAAWTLLILVGGSMIRFPALFNTVPLPFLGAILLVACTAVVSRPGVLSISLAAMIAAIMANVHLACVVTVGSVVWVALLAPRHRIPLAVWGVIVFAVAAVAIAPPSWIHDLTILASREARGHSPGMGGGPRGNILWLANYGIAFWLVSWVAQSQRWRDYRWQIQGAFAVAVPFALAFTIAPYAGLDAGAKYLAHIEGACALMVAVPVGLAVEHLFQRVGTSRLPRLPLYLPLVVAVAIALSKPAGPGAMEEGAPTFADLAATSNTLHRTVNWNEAQLVARVRSPFGLPVLMGMRQYISEGGAAAGDDSLVATLLRADVDAVPAARPGWYTLRRWGENAMVLVTARSRFRWETFQVCTDSLHDSAEATCHPSEWRMDPGQWVAVPHLPEGGQNWRGTLTLVLPIKAGAHDEMIFMPRLDLGCAGRIVSAPTAGFEVEADRRTARLAPTSELNQLEVAWEIGSEDCPARMYDGTPPFFVAGDAAEVSVLADILRRQERGS